MLEAVAEVPSTVTVPLKASEPTVPALPFVVTTLPPLRSVIAPMELKVVLEWRVIVPPSAMKVTGVV